MITFQTDQIEQHEHTVKLHRRLQIEQHEHTVKLPRRLQKGSTGT
jgi:hypothetical protein